ncbi:MAG: SDR family NAD(P)-dependent oxidoreductase [Steroidobacteraceae bacterium]
MELKDKVVVITGGGRGIGRAIATAFAAKGCHLALLDMGQADLEQARDALQSDTTRVGIYTCNVTQEAQVSASLDAVLRDFDRLDIMVNNAGITRDGLLIKAKDGKVTSKMSLEQWQAVIDVNLTGVFLGAREAAERMVNSGAGGVIINISSISRAGNIGQTNYTAAKAGVASMTVVMARELARYNIRAAAIAPGFTNTEILSAMRPEVLERAIAPVPLQRLAEAEEIAHGAIFIAENDYYSGRVLEIDGGLRI